MDLALITLSKRFRTEGSRWAKGVIGLGIIACVLTFAFVLIHQYAKLYPRKFATPSEGWMRIANGWDFHVFLVAYGCCLGLGFISAGRAAAKYRAASHQPKSAPYECAVGLASTAAMFAISASAHAIGHAVYAMGQAKGVFP